MNGSLLTLGVFLLAGGVLLGYTPLLVVGLLTLVAGALVGTRRRKSAETKDEPGKASEPFTNVPDIPGDAMPEVQAEARAAGPSASYSEAIRPLFPYPILPTLSPIRAVEAQVSPTPAAESNELLEIVALLGLSWFTSRRRDQGT